MPGATVRNSVAHHKQLYQQPEEGRDDYYHYYLASQRRVSRWVDQTQSSLKSYYRGDVKDGYPDPTMEFTEATAAATPSRSHSSSSRTRTGGDILKSKKSLAECSEGTLKESGGHGVDAYVALKEEAINVGSGSRASRAGTTIEIPIEDFRSEAYSARSGRPSIGPQKMFSRKLDFDEQTNVGASMVVAYPDTRTRSVIPDNEPTFTEVMARYGEPRGSFAKASMEALNAKEAPSVSPAKSRTSSSRRAKDPVVVKERPGDFDISWTYMQPILLLVASSMLFVTLIPSAAVVVAIAFIGGVLYVTDMVPDLFPRPRRSSSSPSSSSSRRRSEGGHRSTRSSRRSK
ncbi:hypothetical protein FA15DRAFT_136830 [Coprinopsis marcescibilis]|uniref:Uncharacterized protein n=1 Tax=Coprinopsis marcescibilis TaxID=230819 RepID=A0A5C3KWG1_COPMA|nr:hypothetical protein FA15DRAFT_136830 [Coprinopsis marcescibilis]